MKLYTNKDIPAFLIRSTYNCSLTVMLVIYPILISNFLLRSSPGFLGATIIFGLCVLNVFYSFRGYYSLTINSYLIIPITIFTTLYSMYNLGFMASYWAFFISLAFYFILPYKRAILACLISFIATTILIWMTTEMDLAIRFTVALLGTNIFIYLAIKEIYALDTQIKQQATLDQLTGLFNRKNLHKTLLRAINLKNDTGTPVTMILCEVNDLKSINDTLGPDEGDKVLIKTAEILKPYLPSTNEAFRLSGKTFLLVAHNTNQEQAVKLADTLKEQIEDSLSLNNCTVSLSFSVSELKQGMNENSWLKAADDKLHLVKASKNSV